MIRLKIIETVLVDATNDHLTSLADASEPELSVYGSIIDYQKL